MVRKIVALSIGDFKNIRRDPLLVFTMIGAILLACLARFGLPELDALIGSYTSFNLEEHFRLIISLVLLMAPLMVGMLYGFMILDERDEEVLLFYAVTPLTKTGYLVSRLIMPLFVTFLITLAVVSIQGVVSWDIGTFLPTAVLLSLQAPIVTMVMVSFASNKVEGLALSKVINLCIFAPLIDYLVTSPVAKIVMIFPVYWPVEAFMSETGSAVSILMGVFVTFIWFILLNNLFQRKIG